MLDALADGEDVGIRRLHVVVDDDAAIDVGGRPCTPSSTFGRIPAATTTRSASRIVAVLERHAFGVPVADDRGRRSAEQHANAEVLHLAGEVVAAVRIELPFHQRRHQVHDGDVAALDLQAARGLEAEQAAADHHRLHAGSGALQQLAACRRASGRRRRSLVESRDRRLERRAAGREQQRVVRGHAPIVARDGFQLGIDVDDADAEAKPDVVVLIPLERVQRDLVRRPLAGEHRRQQDAVVVDVRLVTEHRDRELRRVLQDLLDAGDARHAVADDDESLHRCHPQREGSTRTAHCL